MFSERITCQKFTLLRLELAEPLPSRSLLASSVRNGNTWTRKVCDVLGLCLQVFGPFLLTYFSGPDTV